ncbi:MAG: EamA family transporter [Planctomycetaceae bacterium]|nr:EamA family transporter [Planctomycetaceae bacterium]|tara:strand:+ start:1200 stop:2045 length:846 start_codon:yes stop_codon:yes gene_type:complete
MSPTRVLVLTSLAMVAFAGNSLLCRLALKDAQIDAASFTSIRLISGAAVLWLIVRARRQAMDGSGDWRSALALFAYAAGFSYAYVDLPAAIGALLLFGAVQVTMIGYGLSTGERLVLRQSTGLVLAFGGLVGLLLPGLSAPPPGGAALMLGAGIAWGVYSIRGKGAGDATSTTAGNFLRAAPLAVGLNLAMLPTDRPETLGIACAVASGAVTSGIGYAIWYSAIRGLKATHAATVQLSVPVIAAAGGIVFLGEAISVRLVIASVAILGGVALVVIEKPASR